MEGRIRKPHQWQGIVKVAATLNLNAAEVDQLLGAAGHASIKKLNTSADHAADLALLQPWTNVPIQPAPPQSLSPFQAHPDLPTFVGRIEEIDAICRTLLDGQHVALYSFQGMAGVGKSALAIHLAYRLRPHFPDGVLWARVDASEPMTVLAGFASAFGQNVNHLRDLESRSAAVRGFLASRRVLVILDNATDSEQVRPLLPPTTGSSAAIITTRRELAIADELHRFEILPFDRRRGESVTLLSKVLGKRQSKAQQKQLVEIADLLGHLPLAVSIAAARIRYHLNGDVAKLLEELHNAEQRLSTLQREHRSVRLSFDLSYQELQGELRRVFDSLGVFGGEDVSVEAIAYVCALELASAQQSANQLHAISLLQFGRNGRYRLHPLLRDYAHEHLAQYTWTNDESPVIRMVTYFARFAEEHSQDYAMLETELSNLLATHEVALAHRMLVPMLQQAVALFPYLELHGLYDVAERQMQTAYSVAEQLQDEQARATTRFYLGVIQMRRGSYAQALETYKNAYEIACHTDDKLLIARSAKFIALTYFSIGNEVDGYRYAERAIIAAQGLNDLQLLAENQVFSGVMESISEFQAKEVGEWLKQTLNSTSVSVMNYSPY